MNRDIPYLNEMLPVSQIKLDPKNPRLQYHVQQLGPGATDQDLHEALWKKDKVKDLSSAIYQNGGIREAIYVVKRVNAGVVEYLVREGNCRTVAGRQLVNQHPGDHRFTQIPAIVFLEPLSDEEWDVLLAEFHVAGKITWDVYEQARQVWKLHKQHGKTYDFLSSHLRMNRSKISTLMSAFELTRQYLEDNGDPSNVRKFSFYFELVKKKALREMIETNDQFREDFATWVRDEHLYDARQVRDLPLILADDPANAALREHGYDEAMVALRNSDPTLGSSLFAVIKQATDYLRNAPVDEIQKLRSGTAIQKVTLLRSLHTAVEDLASLSGLDL